MSDHLVWRIRCDGPRPAREQMLADEQLAQEPTPMVRSFAWNPPAISLGRKQPRPRWLDAFVGQQEEPEIVERPTGGGIAFHGSDISVAIVIPRALNLPLQILMGAICESARRLCETYGVEATGRLDAEGHERIDYCLTQPSPYAVFVRERKVAGFALRRYPQSWLIQGSLLVRPISMTLTHIMPAGLLQEVTQRAVALSSAAGVLLDEREVGARWMRSWASWWEEAVAGELSAV